MGARHIAAQRGRESGAGNTVYADREFTLIYTLCRRLPFKCGPNCTDSATAKGAAGTQRTIKTDPSLRTSVSCGGRTVCFKYFIETLPTCAGYLRLILL